MKFPQLFIEFFLLSLIIVSDNATLIQPIQPLKNSNININYQPSISDNPTLLNDSDSLTIPLKRIGKLLMVEATIDGQSGNLIFDTGASNVVLNRTYFRDYAQSESVVPSGITGSLGKIYRTTVDSLKINGLLYHDVKVDLAELGHIENRRGVKVLGLFGFSLLNSFEVVIDIHNNALRLYRIDKKGNQLNGPKNSFVADYTQEAGVLNNIVFITGNIGGKSLRFCFDTGAEINAISNSEQKKVLSTISVNRRSKIGGAGSAVAEVLYGNMNDFSIGTKKIEDMQTIITNLSSLEEGYGSQFSGVLGFDFLEKGVICINLKKRQFSIRFTKASSI